MAAATAATVAHFTIAYWCVLVAALLPIASAALAKSGGFDNGDPRPSLGRLSGWRARANASQANAFENLPFFIGAVVIAHQLGAPQGRVDLLAVGYVVARVAYLGCYVAGWAGLRSAVFFVGFFLNVAILFAGWR